jgi:branched-chain amino acid transport system permease protein
LVRGFAYEKHCAIARFSSRAELHAAVAHITAGGSATLAIFFAVASTGLNIIYGYAGLLSFAQVGFWGLGAYTSAILCVDYGFSPWVAVIAAGIASVLSALIIGIPALRVSRDAFVIVTLSFSLLLQLLARNWTSLTRGPMGIPGLPTPSLHVPGLGTLEGNDPAHFYWITLTCAAVILILTRKVLKSRFGRALLALNHDEALAKSQSIEVLKHQIIAFCASALLGGLAGGLFVFHLSIVDPTIFDVYYIQMMLIIVVLGGAGYFWEVVLMSLIFTIVPEILRLAPELRMILFGAILVAAIQFFPQGLGGFLAERRAQRWKTAK